jgi:hypothetical protein
LRKKESLVVLNQGQPTPRVSQPLKEEDEDDDEDEDEDEWFR